ncbi:hypothetical protein PanWU01x14_121050, partial [Parasponia andersonii]
MASTNRAKIGGEASSSDRHSTPEIGGARRSPEEAHRRWADFRHFGRSERNRGCAEGRVQ